MNKKIKIIDIFSILFSLVQTVLGVYFITLVLKYATFSKATIILACCALGLMFLLIDLLCFYSIYYQRFAAKIATLIISVIIIGLSIFGINYLQRINKSVDNIITVNDKQFETSTVAFVTYDNEKINSIEDIKGNVKFGYIDNESFIAGNVLALEVVKDNGLNMEMLPYDSYGNLILALFSGEVDIAALPDNYYQMFSVDDGYEEYLVKTKIIHTYSKQVEVTTLSGNNKDLTKDPFTVLLMGIDEQRTDSLMVATFNPQRMIVTMTSIARDSYVPIACYSGGARDKINHARTVSRQCTIDTVEDLMGIEIDFYVEVNFYGVVEMVDAMGGLDLYSPVTFIGQQAGYENDENGRGYFTVWVGEGYLHRDGQQTLALARERHAMPGGDFGRQENQQKIIRAMAEKMLSTRDLNQIISVIEAAGDNIKTNFSLDQISQLVNFGIKMLNSTYAGKNDGVDGIFKFYSSRVTGYASWTYNESLSLPLWIYVPFKGSIADNQALIYRNLQINSTPRYDYQYDYDTLYPYYNEFKVKDTYDEQREYEEIPDIIPYFTNGYSLEDVRAWLKERSWINLTVVEVREGDAGFSSSYSHNQVINQSVAYGKKTANVKELTIWVAKHSVDCKIESYRAYDDCSDAYVVPEFVGMNYSELMTWKTNHPDVLLNITVITDNQSSYNANYENKVSYQSVEAWTFLRDLSGPININYNKKVSVQLDLAALFSYTSSSDIVYWFSSNGFTNVTYEDVYSDSVPAGHLVSAGGYTSASASPIVSTDNPIKVVISKGSEPVVDVPAFVSENDYVNFCNQNGLAPSVYYTETTDSSLNGQIISQSLSSGTYKISGLAGISINVYRYVGEGEE